MSRETAAAITAKLKRDDPELAERVVGGEVTPNAAARAKGWRRPRIVGRDDPDLLRLLRKAKAGKPGRPPQGREKEGDSPSFKHGMGEAGPAADRLARDAPEEYEAVASGAKSIHRDLSQLGPY